MTNNQQALIARLRELDAARTQGTWGYARGVYVDEFGSGQMICGNEGRGTYICHIYYDVKVKSKQTEKKCREQRLSNGRAIMAIPEMLSLINQLDAENKALREERDRLREAATLAWRWFGINHKALSKNMMKAGDFTLDDINSMREHLEQALSGEKHD